ncbi:hypothetical protein [Cylindrospermopsis raciborskii]|uniref:hypothetical protein n=1 Tax=Cylindrospermopsis raciborskii TaxID=77022 RepID=UPI003879D82B
MILSITIPVFIWLVVSNSGLVKPLFLPTPQAVLSALQKLWATGDLQTDIGFSLLRVLGGFLLAAVISIPHSAP